MLVSIRGRASAAAIGALALGALAGCGGDDEKAASGGASSSSKPAALKITATGNPKAPTYEAPAKVPAGVVDITFANNTKGEADGQLVSIDGEHPDAEVVAELKKAIASKPIADWFHGAGGVGGTKPGKTGTVTQVLEPGTYYVLGGNGAPKGAPTKFEATGEGGGALPETDGKVDAAEYAFGAMNLKAGPSKITLANTGQEWHHFLAAQLEPGAKIADVKKALLSENGRPPFVKGPGLQSAVFDPGVSQVVDVDLKPGSYAFFCFLPDRKGGPPHVAKGMVTEVKVQ